MATQVVNPGGDGQQQQTQADQIQQTQQQQTTQQTQQAQPAQQQLPESEGIRNLRTNYEGVKAKLEPWEKLGDYKDVQTRYQQARGLFEEASNLGKTQGYTEAEIAEAFSKDPVATLILLRQEAQKGGGAQRMPDVSKLVEEQVKKALTPIEEREKKRLDDEGFSRISHEFDRVMGDTFKGEQLPPEESAFLYDLTVTLLSSDPEAWARIRNEGKVSDIQRAFDQARGHADKYFLSRTQREAKRSA